jgi:hypothetical protein
MLETTNLGRGHHRAGDCCSSMVDFSLSEEFASATTSGAEESVLSVPMSFVVIEASRVLVSISSRSVACGKIEIAQL